MTMFFRHRSSVFGRAPQGKRPRLRRMRGCAWRINSRGRACLGARCAYVWKTRLRMRAARLLATRKASREVSMYSNTLKAIAEPLRGTPVPAGFDPELLYVECARCGSPVMWEQGKATHILNLAGIDPLELDPACWSQTAAPCAAAKISIRYRFSGSAAMRRRAAPHSSATHSQRGSTPPA